MEYISQFIWMLGHVSEALNRIPDQWIYLVLFVIIFCETGLVVTPFLPGDSLLFVIGTLAGAGRLDPLLVIGILMAAAICGDNTNYWIGRVVGPAVFHREGSSRFFNRKHLDNTHAFFEKHGGKTVIIARFMPIVRTFSPFVAGIGRMNYVKFLTFSVCGGILWVGGLVGIGYFIGNLPWVKKYFSIVIYGIILLSITPGLIEFIRVRRAARRVER